MAPPGRPTRRSRRGELPPPLALKYFTRGALLEALEARGWRQFPASGLHTWVYYTPEGLARRANKEPTARNVDFVLDDDELYAYVELHGASAVLFGRRARWRPRARVFSLTLSLDMAPGILDELVRDKEAAEKAKKKDSPASASPQAEASGHSPLWLNPSTPPPLETAHGVAVQSAESEDAGFIPTSDDEGDQEGEEDAPAGAKDSSRPSGASRKRPRLRTARTAGEKPSRRQSSSSGSASASSARRSSSALRRRSTPRSSPAHSLVGDEDTDDAAARIDREYAKSKRELHGLELELETLEQRVKKKRFAVHKLRIERDCHRERQRKLRELKEQFFGSDIKKEPGIRDCD